MTTSMKTYIRPLLCAASISFASAAITVPGANGTDGALNITANTVIDLSQAPTGAWDNDNTANAGKGVYDASKWAVVFKYSSVNIASGATLTFKNNASRAPVVWLVNGNVTIAGTVSLDGQDGVTVGVGRLAEPGPGGSRGGSGYTSSGSQNGSGFGIGGTNRGGSSAPSYGTQGQDGPTIYGNPSLIPLVGGSGGGGLNYSDLTAGGAAGGALLIACTTNLQITGVLKANGGNGKNVPGYYTWSQPGSGGGIRIISESITGSGQISALGGAAQYISGNGRLRLERVSNNNTIAINPSPSIVDLAANATALLWPPTGAPEVKVVSLGGVNAPADPKSGFGTIGADVAIPTTANTPAVIETTNVEQASQVKVRITPRDTYNYTEVNATYASTVSTSPLVIRWNATLPTNLGYSAVQVRVIRP
jgi:hypothetical protein